MMMRSQEGGWYYEQLELGYNYRITDFQCALGISQLKKLDRFVLARRKIAESYDKAFAGNENVVVPYQKKDSYNSYHLYVIQLKNIDRKKVYEKLQESGIGVNVHYIPVYKHPYYQRIGYNRVYCRNSEELYSRMLSLPIYPTLKEGEQNYVIDQVLKISNERDQMIKCRKEQQ